jgi:hypothetical protein
MSHRAEQIINRAAELHTAAADVAANVFTDRVLSLAEEQDELPAFSITEGADQPQTENMGFIESLLTLRVFAFAVSVDEADLRRQLRAMRARTHRYLTTNGTLSQVNITLGLDFVSDVRYGGALEPQVIKRAQWCGLVECPWHVLYRMNQTDPE